MAINKYDRGITEQKLKQLEHQEILSSAQQDRDWYLQPHWRFPTEEDRDKAIEAEALVKVDANDYFAFAADVRANSKLQYLRPEAYALLLEVMRELDARTNFVRRGIKLIVNSLHRCDDEQLDLVNSNEWYRVAPVGTSSHAAGAAFDINVRTHYVKSSDGQDWVGTWREEALDQYSPEVIEELALILAEFAEANICNMIIENHIENDDYSPACFHVCIAPDSLASSQGASQSFRV